MQAKPTRTYRTWGETLWAEMRWSERIGFLISIVIASVVICAACAGIVFGFFFVIGHPIWN